MAWTWDDLRKQVRGGETMMEGNPEHEAILVARWLHAERMAASPAIEADTVLPATPLAPEDDPALTHTLE